MAFYTSGTEGFLKRVVNNKPHWASLYSPSSTVPVSGIYRCIECKREVTCNQGDPLPPQNHHQHTQLKKVQWQLIVRTDTTGSGIDAN